MRPDLPCDAAALVQQLDADLRTHAAWGDKCSGGPGDLATAQWIEERLLALGFAVQREAVAVPFFAPVRTTLRAGEVVAEVHAQAPVLPTSSDGLHAPLAVVRHSWQAARAQGRIALVVPPHGRHAAIWQAPIGPLVQAAADAGAVAVVVAPMGEHDGIVALNTLRDQPFVPVPTAILAPGDLEPFLRAAENGTMARLLLDGQAGRRDSCNLIGRLLRGPRWLALSTPRTGWFGCASERGTGTAAWLALAAWAVARFPQLSVFVMNCGGHEYDFAGARQAMQQAPAPAQTALWSHIGASLATRDTQSFRGMHRLLPSANAQRLLMATDDLQATATEAFAGIAGLELPWPVQQGAGELSSILAHGYASGFAVLGTPRYFHTRADTLDTVDAGLLAPVVVAHQRLIAHAIQRHAPTPSPSPVPCNSNALPATPC